MKNIIQRGVCLLLLLAVTAALSACGPSGAKNTIYAVEAGSAGEEVAKEKGWTVNSVQDQAAALMEVAAGTSDAAVIDLLMAGAMIGPDTSYPNLTYTDSLTEEEYGIGCRQGSDLADFITEVLEDAYRDGTTQASKPWSGAWPPPLPGGASSGRASTPGWSPMCCPAPASPAAPPLRCCWAVLAAHCLPAVP